jgi:gamma-glutamyl:cysteine ligase YbdK (ATP-grasp superfamily)
MSAQSTPPIKRSIEIEYWVVDEKGRLTDPGELIDAAPGVEREFVKPLVEVKTSPCTSASDLRRELLDRLGDLLQRASELDRRLVPLATPIHADEIEELPSERTRIQNQVIGEEFEYVSHCAGTHVHIEQQPGREIEQLNTLIALDPALALSNSSPYFKGRPLAASARSKLYRWKAYDGVEHQGRLWSYAESIDEWRARIERRYEAFLTRALENGVAPDTVESNFDPESAVWVPVQLRDSFGTVEWRSPDATLPSQVLQLANTVAEIIGQVPERSVRIQGNQMKREEESVVLPEFDVLIDHVNTAIREGLSADSVRSYLQAAGFDIDSYTPLTHQISGVQPSPDHARRLRLKYAQALEDDLTRHCEVRT